MRKLQHNILRHKEYERFQENYCQNISFYTSHNWLVTSCNAIMNVVKNPILKKFTLTETIHVFAYD